LNISAIFLSNTLILSAELFAIQKALETMTRLKSSPKVLNITDLKSAIQLIRKMNYEAADSNLNLGLLRNSQQRLVKLGILICFQHISSHKRLIHNLAADGLPNVFTPTNTKLMNLKDIMKCSG
jgi:hypothetical protein